MNCALEPRTVEIHHHPLGFLRWRVESNHSPSRMLPSVGRTRSKVRRREIQELWSARGDDIFPSKDSFQKLQYPPEEPRAERPSVNELSGDRGSSDHDGEGKVCEDVWGSECGVEFSEFIPMVYLNISRHGSKLSGGDEVGYKKTIRDNSDKDPKRKEAKLCNQSQTTSITLRSSRVIAFRFLAFRLV